MGDQVELYDGSAPIDLDQPVPSAGPRRRRHRRLLIGVVVVAVLLGITGAAGGWYVSTVPVPALPRLAEATTIYYADGKTVMARVADEYRVVVDTRSLPGYVSGAVLSAEDRDFRAGAPFHYPSVISRRYARWLTDERSGGSARLAVVAAKLEDRYGKDKILDAYLNTVYFGRGAYGIEAAATVYFGKPAKDLTIAEAMVLAGMIKTPGAGAYDPAVHPDAARRRWEYVKAGMVAPLGLLDARTATTTFPTDVLPFDPKAVPGNTGFDRPTGLAVHHILSELSQDPASRSGVAGAGYDIVSTIDLAKQRALERYADAGAAGSVLHDQPHGLLDAAVAIEPRTGRVLAYYGGSPAGPDLAGVYTETSGPDAGRLAGFGAHPAGTSFAVYDLAAALRRGISVRSWWDTRHAGTFPQASPDGHAPVVDDNSCPTGTDACTLADSVTAGLNVPLFALTEKIGPTNVARMAHAAGIDLMWQTTAGARHRIDMRDPVPDFDPLVGLGQNPITVLDHANGMATFAARGERAQPHFIASVTKAGKQLYHDSQATTPTGLTPAQLDDLTWTLSRSPAGRLPDGRKSAAITSARPPAGTNDAWIAGFTPQLALAVWVGSQDPAQPIKDRAGALVTGATLPAQIYRGFLAAALDGSPHTTFNPPAFVGDATAGNAQPPPDSAAR